MVRRRRSGDPPFMAYQSRKGRTERCAAATTKAKRRGLCVLLSCSITRSDRQVIRNTNGVGEEISVETVRCLHHGLTGGILNGSLVGQHGSQTNRNPHVPLLGLHLSLFR
jgi:hypothetical protein